MKYFLLEIFLILFLFQYCKEVNEKEKFSNKRIITDSQNTDHTILKEFADLGIIEHHFAEMHDWGKFHYSKSNHGVYKVTTISEIQKVIKIANKLEIPVRIRGRGHSMNGSSLPREEELVLNTEHLRFLKNSGSAMIEVGSGVAVFDLNYHLKKYGYSLPVYNDGDLGPSIGGFISASGLAIPAAQYGGFWENVEEITIVDGKGNVHKINKGQEDFRWFFGAMGQLGFIYSARLNIVPVSGSEQKPVQSINEIPEYWKEDPEHRSHRIKIYEDLRMYWYTVMAPKGSKSRLLSQLMQIRQKYKDALSWNSEYIWPIKFKNFNPPLLYRWQKDFVAIGIWGYNTPSASFDARKMLGIQRAVSELVKSNSEYASYLQAELAIEDVNWREVWGDEIFKEFKSLKSKYDPVGILNQGLVF